MAKKTLISWSTGKDSAWMLDQLTKNPSVEITGLFCTVNEEFARTAMHAVRVELLKLQAERLGLALSILKIPYPCSNERYEKIMGEFSAQAVSSGVQCFAFGDLYLEDIRAYREAQFQNFDLELLFPIWKQPTDQLAKKMVNSGLKAVVTCVDPKQISPEFAGREFNKSFLEDLPEGVDPCGENGEFHTFVYDSPAFSAPIEIQRGKIVERDGFVFADIELRKDSIPLS